MNTSKNQQLENFRLQEKLKHEQKINEQLSNITPLNVPALNVPAVTKPATLVMSPQATSYHFQQQSGGVAKYSMSVDVRSLHRDIEDWKDVNPRTISEQDNHVKLGILDTLRNAPEEMIRRNMGLTLTAKSVTLDDDGNVTLKLTDKELHGLLNGGHTTHWILQVAKEMRDAGTYDTWEAFVPVTIYVGLKTKEDVAKISDPLNTNVAVKRSMSAHMRGKYDILIDALKDKHYFDKLSFKGGTTGKPPVAVQDVFRILIAFDKFNFPDGESNPVRVDLETSKTGKGSFTAILDAQFDADFEPVIDASTGLVKKHRNSMKMLFENADTLLQLRDKLTVDLLTNHESLVTNVVSNGATAKRMLSGNKKALPFLLGADNKPVKVAGQQWKGWILPIVGAFRANVKWNSTAETIGWHVPNNTLIKSAMPEMIRALSKQHKAKGQKPENLLRDGDTYKELYAICDKHVKALQAKAKKKA